VRLLPASLFGRTALLILAVLLLSQAGVVALFRHFRSHDFAGHIATLLAAQVEAVTTSLNAVDGDDRTAYIERLEHSRYLRLLPDQGGTPPGPVTRDPLSRRVAPLLAARLGYPTTLYLQPGRLWIRVRSAGLAYWLMLPRPPHEHPLPWRWVAAGALMGLLALGGAFALVWRINRPLRRLTAAVSLVGQGAAPPQLEDNGPAEIGALSRAFNQMAADLRTLDADRTLFLASVSHDLRTPLARLRLGVEMLDGQANSAMCAGMVQDIEHIDAVVGQFLAYVRDDECEAVATEGDLNRIVTVVAERYQSLGTPLSTHLRPLPPLRLRATAMQRLLTNLADNALHYGGENIEIETAVEGERVVLRVLDRGPGIPDAQLEAMLQPFTRLESARSGGGGTGLGLAIVARIAKLHGGEVRLLNRDGGGLEARILLPLPGKAARDRER